jgi:hypothetical protein
MSRQSDLSIADVSQKLCHDLADLANSLHGPDLEQYIPEL